MNIRHCERLKKAKQSSACGKDSGLRRRLHLLAMTIIFICLNGYVHAEKVLDIQTVVSEKGINAWLVEDHSVPIITMKIGFRGGSVYDPLNKQGLSQLLSNTLDEGAGEIGPKDFQKALNDKSITLNFQNSRDGFFANVKTLTKYKEETFKLLELSLTEPRFEQEAVTRMIEANLMRLRGSLSNPAWIQARLSNDKAYEGHPYALNSGGTLSSLPTLTPQDLKSLSQTKLNKEDLVVSVVGDITAEELKTILDDVFGMLPDQKPLQDNITDITIQNQGKTYLYSYDIPQSFIEMQWNAVPRNSENFYPALILNHILGGAGFGSLLMEEIREKRGLTYGIYSNLNLLQHANALSISTATQHENIPEIITQTKAIIEMLKSQGPEDKAIQTAKNYLIGSLPLQLTTTDDIASILLGLQMENLPIDYLDAREEKIRNVTKQDLIALANTIFKEEALTILVGQPVLPEGLKPIIIKELPNVQ